MRFASFETRLAPILIGLLLATFIFLAVVVMERGDGTGAVLLMALASSWGFFLMKLRSNYPKKGPFADFLPEILWTENASGELTFLNQRWTEFTGEDSQRFASLGWAELVHPDDRAESERTWIEAHEHGVAVEREHRLRRGSDGAYVWFRQNAWPIKNGEGKINGWAGSLTDIHELKSALHERDAALHARDEFLSIASHELRTPLTSLRLKAQTLLRGMERGDPRASSPERVKDFGAHADKQVSRLSRLIEDMLEVSKLRNGQMELHPEPADFGAIVKQTVSQMRPQFAAINCPLTLTIIGNTAFPVRVDPARIEQVVSNLLANALRYGLGRPVDVMVSGDEESAIVRVTDHGIGIAPEHQRKIFNRFDRAVSANEISGLGLGLFISNQIVTAHGGQIRVKSRPGSGSVFELRFPLVRTYKPTNNLRVTG